MVKTDFNKHKINSDIKRIYDDILNSNLNIYSCKNCSSSEMLIKIPNFSGLIFLTEEIDNCERIVFVGESKNVHRRCKEYFSDKARNATLKRHVGASFINIEIKDGKLPKEVTNLWWDYNNPSRFCVKDYIEIENRIIDDVHNYIKNHVRFRLVHMNNGYRRLAWKLLATLLKTDSFVCRSWLGLYSPYTEVKQTGMWAKKQFTSNRIMQEKDFILLEQLIREMR